MTSRRILSVLLTILMVAAFTAGAEEQIREFAPVQKGFAERGEQVLPYAPDRVLVKLAPNPAKAMTLAPLYQGAEVRGAVFGLPQVDALARLAGVRRIERPFIFPKSPDKAAAQAVENWYMLHVEPGDMEALAAELKQLPDVETAQPDWRAFPAATPNDPMFPDNWGHNNTAQLPDLDWGGTYEHTLPNTVGTVGFDSNAQPAWDASQGYGSSGIVIAIIDSGVDVGHPDLNQVTGYDYGDNDSNPDDDSASPGHGTACAGVAAAIANNGLGVVGIAGGCSIMPLKVANSAGSMFFSSIVNAIYYAADNGADMISMSFSADISSDASTDAAIQYAYNAGVVLMAATSNDNQSHIHYPANNTYVMGIGAASPCGDRKRSSSSSAETNPGVSTDPNGYTCDGERWWGSNYGVTTRDAAGAVDVIAPTILPTTDIQGSAGYDPGNYSGFFNGTSCSTPYVAGVAALVKSKNPGWTNAQIRDQIVNTAIDITNVESGSGWDRYSGYGMVDAEAAVGGGGGPVAPVAEFTGSPTSGTEPLNVAFTDQSTNSPTSWFWNFGDGGTSGAQNPSHTYTAAGTYTVSLEATNAGGFNTETKTNYITVNPAGSGFCDDFNDGDASDWTATGGTWTVVGQQLDGVQSSGKAINLAPAGNVGAATISLDWTSLTGGSWTNGMVVFGYVDAQNYRVLDCRDGANNWYIREFVGGVQSNKANFAETINTSQQYQLEIVIDASGLVSATVDGVPKVSYDFGNVVTGQVGVAVENSHSRFDNFCVDTGGGPTAPVAEFSGTPTSGSYPLAVQFTDASTNVPTSWSWTFGDGGTSTARNPNYTYTAAGNYTVTLTATNTAGSDGETKVDYITATEPAGGGIIGEVASITRNQTAGEWYPVTLSNTYTDPVVVMKALSYNGSHQTHLRVRGVTASGFEWQMEEWEYHDGSHTTEDCPYIVVEAGAQTLGDGTLMEAGTIDVTDGWSSVTLTQSFTSPVLLTGVMTQNDVTPCVTRTRNLASGGFDIRVQEEEANDGIHGTETVAWIVIEAGSGTNDGTAFLAARTPNAVTQAWYTVSLTPAFAATPILLCHDDTFDGNNPAGVRYRNLGTSSFEVFSEEEASLDAELTHTSEVVSYLAWGTAGNIVAAGGGGMSLARNGSGADDELTKSEQLPSRFVLHQNYPNPFNPTTTIEFDLPRDAHVRIDVFDLRGSKVVTLTNRRYTAGVQQVTWNAKGVASGVYFYRVQAGRESSMHKMTLLK